MEQATATAPTDNSPRAQDEFAHAAQLAAGIVLQLEQKPCTVEVGADFPSGWRLRFVYRTADAAGLFELAALLDVPVTRADTELGVHLDAVARVETIEISGGTFVTEGQAARLTGLPGPLPSDTEFLAAVEPVALGASVLAQIPAVTPVVPAPAEATADDDVARCQRCGCTEDAACEGGCYWVANPQFIDLCSACATAEELAVMSYTPASSEQGGGQ